MDWRRTEDGLLGRRQHVEGECDFILVFFDLQPAHEGRKEGLGGGAVGVLLLVAAGVVGHRRRREYWCTSGKG
jgi:hypothetical protein